MLGWYAWGCRLWMAVVVAVTRMTRAGIGTRTGTGEREVRPTRTRWKAVVLQEVGERRRLLRLLRLRVRLRLWAEERRGVRGREVGVELVDGRQRLPMPMPVSMPAHRRRLGHRCGCGRVRVTAGVGVRTRSFR